MLRRAAFYDMDGTLVKGNVVKHYLFFALHAQQFTERARRIATSHLGVERLAAELAAAAPDHPSRHYASFLWLERSPERGLSFADAAPPLSPSSCRS